MEFSFSLSSLVPGLKFYPRIRYRSCILQMAEWHFDATELDFLQHKELHESLSSFRDFAKSNNLPRYFAYTFSDNFLVFDLKDDEDVVFFLKEIKNKNIVLLKEFPFIDNDSTVEDNFKRPLLAQYVASLYSTEEIYKNYVYKKNKKSFYSVKSTKDWLYFKIYCHPLSSDIILCDYFFALIRKYIKDGTIEEWFWVRYQDPEYHIRLRIKPAQNKHSILFEIFNLCLNKLCSVKLVHHFQTDIYKRETDRYSVELIRYVEAVFNSSSNMIASFLKMKYTLKWTDEKLLVEAVSSAHEMLHYFDLSYVQRIDFCKVQFDHLFHEFSPSKSLKPELEKLYKTLNSDILFRFKDRKNKGYYRLLKKDIANLNQNFKDGKLEGIKVEKLAADIVHMHLNRLFNYDQRYFEMVVYYLLYRSLSAEMHKSHSSRH